MGTRAWTWVLLGLVQGGLLWALNEPGLLPTWFDTAPIRAAALVFLLGWPVAVYQSADAGLSRARRALLLALVALWLAGLSAYQAMGQPALPASSSPWALLPRLGLPATLGIALGSVVLIALWLGWNGAQRRFDYARLFEFSWRNALLLALAPLLTGVCWLTLFAGAWLMRSIGIEAVLNFISKPAFAWPASTVMLALAWQQGLQRAPAMAGLRRFWLGLNAWFLPLALGFATVWMLALPLTGLQSLFDTRHAAFVLMWFALLSIHFCNAAWQDGQDAMPYPRWLGQAIAWSLPSLVVVLGIAGLALGTRIAQHGLSVDRIWALYVCVLLSLYALGYSASLLPAGRRRGWLAGIGPSNTAVALFGLLLLGLLLSPVGDARRLAVQQQLWRLDSGRITPEQFDYPGLLRQSGPAGRAAIEALAQRQGDERARQIAGLAAAALGQADSRPQAGSRDAMSDPQASAQALSRLRHWPVQAKPDPEFLTRFTLPHADWRDRDCLSQLPHCLLWLVDLDGDGHAEVVMLKGARPGPLGVYRREAEGWRYAGAYIQTGVYDFEALRHMIETGDLSLRKAWAPELLINQRAARFVPD